MAPSKNPMRVLPKTYGRFLNLKDYEMAIWHLKLRIAVVHQRAVCSDMKLMLVSQCANLGRIVGFAED